MGGPVPTTLSTASVRYAAMEIEAPKRAGDGAVKDVPVVHSADRFTLSAGALKHRVSTTSTDQALAGAYEALAAEGHVDFEAAGKTEYLESVANPTDLSPEATADRILGGITGYIFGAFEMNKPEYSAEDFDAFHVAVTEGFEKGLREAADILRGMDVMTNEVSENIAKMTELVRDGLANFYESIADGFNNDTPPLQVAAV